MNAVWSTRRNEIASAVLGGLAGAMLVGTPALAHTGLPAGGLVDGVLHPLRGVDHVVAMVAVGIVAIAARNRRIAWLTPLGFLVGMVMGGGLGLARIDVPHVETLIAASVLALGIAVVASTSRAGYWLPAVAAAFGAVHGFAHGAEQPAGSSAWLYVAGFVAVTASLHLSGTVLGLALRRVDVLRITTGAAVSAAGVSLLLA